ncbi:unnamed protein product [Durusdinium trenchii]|uniref:Uncharacterized protein n=1 Tax=Durusdinium trenchii TaxID=1381693 RepID=A0ABP0NAR0_9DINO
MAESFLFKAALLLDRYSSCCANLPKLPLTCAAIARLGASAMVLNFKNRRLNCCDPREDFATWVGTTFDCMTEEITNSTLKEHELEVLKALDWKVDCPCLEQWLLMFSVRFNGLTGGQNTVQLQMMMQSILHSSHAILMSETVAQKLSHGDLAMGLFCANVLLLLHGDSPLMSLKPYEVSEMEWSGLFTSLAACKPGKADRASGEASSRLLDTLCLTVQQNEKEIGEKVHHAVREYQNAFGRISVI